MRWVIDFNYFFFIGVGWVERGWGVCNDKIVIIYKRNLIIFNNIMYIKI